MSYHSEDGYGFLKTTEPRFGVILLWRFSSWGEIFRGSWKEARVKIREIRKELMSKRDFDPTDLRLEKA